MSAKRSATWRAEPAALVNEPLRMPQQPAHCNGQHSTHLDCLPRGTRKLQPQRVDEYIERGPH
eukprot:6138093-Lingulodinium_polyedra.AAC.1